MKVEDEAEEMRPIKTKEKTSDEDIEKKLRSSSMFVNTKQ